MIDHDSLAKGVAVVVSVAHNVLTATINFGITSTFIVHLSGKTNTVGIKVQEVECAALNFFYYKLLLLSNAIESVICIDHK